MPIMPELHVIAHDIRSRENVGALFRTADALGIKKLWLTGYTPAPPDRKITKVALGAEQAVMHERVLDVAVAVSRLKDHGFQIIALETLREAVLLENWQPSGSIALLLGSERTGIAPSVLALTDCSVRIRQRGMKESLNVAIAAGIAAWHILNTPPRDSS